MDAADLEHPMNLLEKAEGAFHRGYPVHGAHTEAADSAVVESMSGGGMLLGE